MVRQVAPGLQQTSVQKLPLDTLHHKGISRVLLRYNQASVQDIQYASVLLTNTWWRMSGMRSYNPEQIMLSAAVRRSSRDVNIMKEKLIFSEVSNGVSNDEQYTENGFNYYTS
ncbi:Glycerophosphodiester phosphodiesterase domain-containing protein 5 [Anabarilius grahami]|uniref:Glycerophosphodiester phosphodiesterase domain-containing protein 5 n=1 Tax=Anabarilius grahami TaxID=495550 RepID=A0A3N0XY60_ANAGA|nr:Glycerophosphodiester phosphodiesterase domain-containing protein 5 [Anabarilius grahami]